jgi:class 3 adenylate cyclase
MGEIRDIRSNRSDDRHSVRPRLAAIVAGDIARCGRLLQVEENGTHARTKGIEREIIAPNILAHHGRLVKTTVDGFIAIFDNPGEAARCGIAIQQCMLERNALRPKHHWVEYRIGVNLGEVVTEPNDVYGAGIQIASRLTTFAGLGQVCISAGIYEQVKHKLVCGYEPLTDRNFKNITDPARVYRVLSDPDEFHGIRTRAEGILIFLLSLALVVIASGALWYLFEQPHRKAGEEAYVAGSQETQRTIISPQSIIQQATPLPPSNPAANAQGAAPQTQTFASAQQSASQLKPSIASDIHNHHSLRP